MKRGTKPNERHRNPALAGGGRRRAPRYPADIDCSLVFGGEAVLGLLIDLSATGASISLPVDHPVAESLDIRLELRLGPKLVLTLPVEIVGQEPDPFEGSVVHLVFGPHDRRTGTLLEEVVGSFADRFKERQAAVFSNRLAPWVEHRP